MMGRLVVEKSAEVAAPAQAIWEEMVAVSRWPEWKPFIEKAKIAGGYKYLTAGAKISFSAQIGGPVAIPLRATVTEFDLPRRLSWQGGVPGLFAAVHTFEFQETAGKTRVVSREEFSGVLLPLVKLMVSEQDLEKLHEEWVAAIKKRMEPEAEEKPTPAHH